MIPTTGRGYKFSNNDEQNMYEYMANDIEKISL
jgi:hypothetical protein